LGVIGMRAPFRGACIESHTDCCGGVVTRGAGARIAPNFAADDTDENDGGVGVPVRLVS